MKKVFTIVLAALALTSCNMDLYRSDALTAEDIARDPNAPLLTTNGIYTLFQDRIAYTGQSDGESGNYYIRHYFQIAELRGDNVTVSGITEDPFINPYRYTDDNTAKNIYYTWWMAYNIIETANNSLALLDKAEKTEMNKHLIGENLFFRALCHFQMVTLFAMPYVDGPDNIGVPLRTGEDNTFTSTRATVGAVYEQIVNDLIAAKENMAADKEGELIRGNDKGYVSWHAATALLSRVYLYMEKNKECIKECDELMENPSPSLSGYDFADYPKHTYDHPETIWCVHLKSTHEWAVDHGEASIASMYLKAQLSDVKTIGWGEHYWSENLIDLFRRYPEDKRFKAYFLMIDPRAKKDVEKLGEEYKPQKNYDEMAAAMKDKLTVVFPVAGPSGQYCTGSSTIGCKFNADGSVKFQTQGEQIGVRQDEREIDLPVYAYHDHVAKRKILHERDTIYFVENSDTNFPGMEIDGVKRVWVRPGPAEPKTKVKWDNAKQVNYSETQADANARFKAAIGRTDNGGFYMRYYNTKFSGQDGMPMVTSPVFLRWGEVLLNRAEANAKEGNDGKALDDINILRSRAGIPQLSSGDVNSLGYAKMLDLVLDERRMELCFEGHRFFDVFRNKLPLDRRYIGYHNWEVIQPGDPRIALLISQDEINASGIPQNPR